MKLLLLLALIPLSLWAQVPDGAPKPKNEIGDPIPASLLKPFDKLGKDNLIVKTKYLSGGSTIDRNWGTPYGSYDRDIHSMKEIQVDLIGLSQNKGPIVIEFFFALKDEVDGLRYYQGQAAVSDLDRGRWIFTTTISRNDKRYAALGRQYRQGARITGWFVRVIRDFTIIGIAGSGPKYEMAAGDPNEVSGARLPKIN